MESKKKNIFEMLARVTTSMLTPLDKIRSRKLPSLRHSASQIQKNSKKTKLLKAKYSHSRLRTDDGRKISHNRSGHSQAPHLKSRFSQFCLSPVDKIKGFKFPKFSLSQLSVTGGIRRYINYKSVIATIVILVLSGFLISANAKVNAFAVEVNGKRLAVTTDKTGAEKLIQNLKAEKARIWKRNVVVQQNLAFKNIQAKKYQLDNSVTLKSKLNKSLTFIAVATGIKVNGRTAVVVKDNQTAEQVLQQVKDSFKSDNLNIESVNFQEKVELAEVPVSLKEVLPAEKAVQLLKEGKQKKLTHVVVKGDSLWSIARHYDMHVADLLQINPAIKGEHLDLGQAINLVALEPMVNVAAVGQMTTKENVPYKVIVQNDSRQWRGSEKVKIHGKNGLREVTYKLSLKNGAVVGRQVLNEKVLQAPTNQVVVRGSRYVVASRSGGGKIGWPISGRITSGYGRRWGSMHTGLDIDGTTGEPVGAAAAGTVISAGWDGGYGKLVTIRHSNGLVTRYGHLSSIKVSVGQHVERGDLIGLVGSTGHSTGSHLHFEVLAGGSFQNPLKYLK